MEAQPEQIKQSSRQLARASIILGVIAIAPLLISLVGTLLELIFHINLQWLRDFILWLGTTRLVVYIGALGLPGLIVGIMAFTRAATRGEKWRAVVGILLGLVGVMWAGLIWYFLHFPWI